MPTGGDDPFKPANATVLRPKPGAGKRTPPASRPPATAQTPRRMPTPQPLPVGGGPVVRPLPGQGLNPLLTAAVPLLLMAGGMRGSTVQGDVPALRRQALEEIRRFEESARAAGIANEVIIAGRYALCAALDEAVLATPWGAHSDWAQQTLLNTLHREAYGGEKFFEMLERIAQEPALRIDLIELQYLCIALGFAGKFQLLEQGQTRLAQVQHGIFQRIRSVRSPAEPELSLHWEGVTDRRNRLARYLPWWVAAAAALTVVMGTFLFLKYRLDTRADPIYAALAQIGTESAAPAAPAPHATPPAGPTLRQLLADEESAGKLLIDENGPQTRVTIVAPELFAAGSRGERVGHAEARESPHRAGDPRHHPAVGLHLVCRSLLRVRRLQALQPGVDAIDCRRAAGVDLGGDQDRQGRQSSECQLQACERSCLPARSRPELG